ncbi:NAD-dependent succinate-semialdehyde dehydrogenase [Agrobacterium rosae]|nr:NAD-dependent succinate-semialdehyde dehydrogenase [Agrobacterium rosae]MBN7808269.1 NAD-dependent succinate-semialdehyde dehydrogenase [Agrobacterium rosae]
MMSHNHVGTDWLNERNFIDGAWIEADDRKTLGVTDPATDCIIGTVPYCGANETARAILAANNAFLTWSKFTAGERARVLHRMADLIHLHRDELAGLLTLEQGKPLLEARGEIDSAAAYVTWFAEQARRINGETIPSPWADRRIIVAREPVGVVGAITPWNFPFSMIARKLAAALAAGCTIVVKPSELTPYCGLAWGKLAVEAGVPAGVVNVVTGDPIAIGAELTSSRMVSKITFTGSTAVGKLLYGQSAHTMKRVSMELGGNAPFIVFDDADINKAVEGAMASKFRNSGQTCVCTNRFYIHDSVYDAFLEKLSYAVETLKIGNGFDEGVEQGPLINTAALEKVEHHISNAVADGGRIVVGGQRHKLGKTFFQPTVLADVKDHMAVCREETFGPLAAVSRFRTDEEVITAANATDSGLAAYFYTQSLKRTFAISQSLKFGMIGVNAGLISTEVAPFGGVKESGIGREGSTHGLDDYLTWKYMCLSGL